MHGALFVLSWMNFAWFQLLAATILVIQVIPFSFCCYACCTFSCSSMKVPGFAHRRARSLSPSRPFSAPGEEPSFLAEFPMSPVEREISKKWYLQRRAPRVAAEPSRRMWQGCLSQQLRHVVRSPEQLQKARRLGMTPLQAWKGGCAIEVLEMVWTIEELEDAKVLESF